MKTHLKIIGIILLITLIVGCSKPGTEQLANQYAVKAQEYEATGDLVNALEQYKNAVAIDPENQLARDKSNQIEQQLRKMAESHYQTGLAFHGKGQYLQARKEFLTALGYFPEYQEVKEMLTAYNELDQVSMYILHTIQPDESISMLAERFYGDYKKFHLIAQYNGLEDATAVMVGRQIKIPVIEGIPIIADSAEIRTDSGQASQAMLRDIIVVKDFITHTVQPGESLSKLAQVYYGDYKKFGFIAKFNDLENTTSVSAGLEIKIPEVEGIPILVKKEEEEKLETSMPRELSEAAERPEEEKMAELKIEKKKRTIEDQTASYRELGIGLFDKKKYADAIIEFHKVLDMNPGDTIANRYLSLACFEQGISSFKKEEYTQAIKDFKAAQQYNKECEKCDAYIRKSEEIYKDLHYRKGISFFKDEKLAESIYEWELVYKMDPKYKDVDKNLKKVRKLLKRLEDIKKSKKKETH